MNRYTDPRGPYDYVETGHGAPITESIHEVERSKHWPATLESPGESWVRCTCGWEGDSQGSAGGAEWSVGDLFQQHREDVGADA